MKYDYYKQKYKAITIKLDREADSDVIDYIENAGRQGYGPKTIICDLIRGHINMIDLAFCVLGDETEVQ